MFDILVPLLLIALLINIGQVVFSITRQDRNRSLYFSILCTCLFIYTLGYLLEVMSYTVEAAFVALQIQNFAIPMIGPLFLLTTLSLFRPNLVHRGYLMAACIYAFALFCVVLFNNYHWLYYTSMEMQYDGNAHYYIVLGRSGPIYILQQIVSVTCMIAAYGFILVKFIRGSSKLRAQMLYFILGSLAVFISNILNISGLLPAGLDPTPLAMTLGMLCFSTALFRDNLLDIVHNAFNLAVETMDDALIVVDNDVDYLYGNDKAKQLFPRLKEYSGTEPVEQMEGWPEELRFIHRPVKIDFQKYSQPQDKETYFQANVQEITNKRGKQMGWSILIRDTTNITLMVKQLENLATIDSLSGILNRRQWLQTAAKELERAKRKREAAALVLYDIDFFKKVNDTYGHLAGDMVIRETSAAIKNSLREYDVFGRFGGEEFVVFTAGCSGEALENFVERLRAAIENLIMYYDGRAIRVTASFGVVEILPSMDLNLAISLADAAMYRAKSTGRNRMAMADKNLDVTAPAHDFVAAAENLPIGPDY